MATHSITAVYTPASDYLTSTSAATTGDDQQKRTDDDRVDPVSPTTAVFGTPVTLTVTVAPVDPGNTPTGTITFFIGADQFGLPMTCPQMASSR